MSWNGWGYALKRGFGLSQDQQPDEAWPGQEAVSMKPVAGTEKEIVQGKIRLDESEPALSKAKVVEVIEDDGTRHQYKDGKIIACKKPGQNWRYFLD